MRLFRLKTYLAADADGDTSHPADIEEDALKLVLGLRAKRSSIERTVWKKLLFKMFKVTV